MQRHLISAIRPQLDVNVWVALFDDAHQFSICTCSRSPCIAAVA